MGVGVPVGALRRGRRPNRHAKRAPYLQARVVIRPAAVAHTAGRHARPVPVEAAAERQIGTENASIGFVFRCALLVMFLCKGEVACCYRAKVYN